MNESALDYSESQEINDLCHGHQISSDDDFDLHYESNDDSKVLDSNCLR